MRHDCREGCVLSVTCLTPAASSWRRRPWPPAASPHSHALASGPHVARRLMCSNAARRATDSGSSSARTMKTPMRRIRSACCARAASGHAAAPPSSVMKSRRFIASRSSRLPHGTHKRQDTIASRVAVTLIGHPLSNKRMSLL